MADRQSIEQVIADFNRLLPETRHDVKVTATLVLASVIRDLQIDMAELAINLYNRGN